METTGRTDTMNDDPTNEMIKLSENMLETLEQTQEAVDLYCNKTLDDYTEYNLPDLIQLRHNLKQIITPLEINIRLAELNLKNITITLKNTSEYTEQYKTQKAREEQAIIETHQLKTLLLQLKKNRNMLRDTHDLLTTITHLEFILLEQNDEEEDEGIRE